VSQSRLTRDADLLALIDPIKADHPFWGYRRVWAYLRHHQQIKVSRNRVYRIMKEFNLLVQKNQRLKAKRTAYRSKPKATRLNQFWGMDMTKICFPEGWRYLHVVKDWYSKELIGWHLSHTSRTADWLEALNQAVNQRFPEGIRAYDKKPSLITDNGCQPTSSAFMEACGQLDIKQIFTSFNNPKGNADTERVIRTIKEDAVWPFEWQSAHAFKEFFTQWVKQYNQEFPHMSLNWLTPFQFANNTLLFAA
jgi:transposase InsO family protein